jgi:hypothetical protein
VADAARPLSRRAITACVVRMRSAGLLLRQARMGAHLDHPTCRRTLVAIRAPISNHQPRIVQRDSASCICRKSAGAFFL